MVNTLYLPELREMLAENNANELREFCTALHPGRTAEFMEGLSSDESWQVLHHAEDNLRQEVFRYFEEEKQIELIETQDRHEIAAFVAEMKPDERVDILQAVTAEVVSDILPLLPADERRDFLRLRSYPEGTAGAVMTTDVAKFSEALTVSEAFSALGSKAEELETIYYFYIVDETEHLRGVVSCRQLVSAYRNPSMPLSELMESDLVAAHEWDDQEDVAKKVARYNLLAIPVVDAERRMLGIITHDDVLDVMQEEATEDAHRIAAVAPLDEGYLQTSILTLTWKRGLWLIILFFAALLTAFALKYYEDSLNAWTYLVWFIPLVISSGGNTGSQSATLIITALATGDVRLKDSTSIIMREMAMGLLLGSFLALLGFFAAWAMSQDAMQSAVVAGTLVLVVICGTLLGSVLPLLFQKLGLDPAMMSNPFVAGLIDILGIVIYMNVAMLILSKAAG